MSQAPPFPLVRPVAVGQDRVTGTGSGSVWLPRLLALYGLGLVGAVTWVVLIVRPAPAVMVAFGLAVLAGWLWVSITFARAASGQVD
ncbi:hypothetical protein NKG94_38705 [Micromonospora sp. M12]